MEHATTTSDMSSGSEDESVKTTTEMSSNNSVYLTPSMSGVDLIDSKMTQSEFTVIESDEVNQAADQSSSASSDDTVDTDELPDLVQIEAKAEEEKPIEKEEKEEEVESVAEEPVSPWDDVLGTGRLHIRKLAQGDLDAKCERGALVNVEVLTPTAPFSIHFGTDQAELVPHSRLELTMSDHVEPAPGAVELALHGMGRGGEVAVRAHADLRGDDLPDEFHIRVISVERDELKQASLSKDKGNALYKNADFAKAAKYYERGVSYLNEYYTENEINDESKDVWIKLNKNLGRCYFKLGQNAKSLEKFDEILVVDETSQDVLLLKVEVLTKENRLDELMETCTTVLALKPAATIATKMTNRIEKIKQVKKAQEEKYRRMCQKMTGTYEQPIKEAVVLPATSANQPEPKQTDQSPPSPDSSFTQLMVVGAIIAAGAAVAFFVLSKK